MRTDLQYHLDLGGYFGGSKRALEQLSQEESGIICREVEEYYTYSGCCEPIRSSLPSENIPIPLFWKFPNERGCIQQWRLKLWEHRNK
ncbi:hypothetical protein [Paenibacillus wynnii]|uniref:Uncharacterized protein n=1 Tax=Paenibacillus wynnii TaxID=268407 RepID=A0A098MEG8_9BACL|nr:hypothetical protein [Paenibacillus wynnii]KGE20945.1 hypothetical protein PWYN_01940 [Paenibacillus wynnii]